MGVGLSDKIRAMAQAKYVNPALRSGKTEFSIRVRDLLTDLQTQGFPAGNTPQICNALKTTKFLRDNGLEIESVEGPPSKVSPTVVFKYRVGSSTKRGEVAPKVNSPMEDPIERALRLTEKLRGVLKEELAEYGGGEAFLRWIRSEDEDAA